MSWYLITTPKKCFINFLLHNLRLFFYTAVFNHRLIMVRTLLVNIPPSIKNVLQIRSLGMPETKVVYVGWNLLLESFLFVILVWGLFNIDGDLDIKVVILLFKSKVTFSVTPRYNLLCLTPLLIRAFTETF